MLLLDNDIRSEEGYHSRMRREVDEVECLQHSHKIEVHDVNHAMRNMDGNKSAGFDCMPIELVRKCYAAIRVDLCKRFSKLLGAGVFAACKKLGITVI